VGDDRFDRVYDDAALNWELHPPFDPTDNPSLVGATLIYRALCLVPESRTSF